MSFVKMIPEEGIRSSSGVTWLNEDGIITAIGKYHRIHTLAHALENHAITQKLAAGIRRPFLIDMTEVQSMTQEARNFYAGPAPAQYLTAVAIVTVSHIGKTIGNTFILLSKPILPTRMFTDHDLARAWLMDYRTQ